MDTIRTVDFELFVRGAITTVTDEPDFFVFDTDSSSGRAVTADPRATEILTFGTGGTANSGFAINGRPVDTLVDRFVFDGVDNAFTAGDIEISFSVLQTTTSADPFHRFFSTTDSADFEFGGFGAAIFDPVDENETNIGFDPFG